MIVACPLHQRLLISASTISRRCGVGTSRPRSSSANSGASNNGSSQRRSASWKSGAVLILPNGDRATLVCPVSGEATLESLTDSGLPGVLPPGRTFVSGVDVGLTEGGVPLQVIFDGGFITLSFPIPDGWADASLAVLYWDPVANGGAGGWVELPPYALQPDGTPMVHSLHPGAEPPDGMEILGGVRVVGGSVKIAVNFPGIFVLAAR